MPLGVPTFREESESEARKSLARPGAFDARRVDDLAAFEAHWGEIEMAARSPNPGSEVGHMHKSMIQSFR